jgi:hypothetical protein
MRFHSISALALLTLIPVSAFALTYGTDVERYSDWENMSRAERAGVNLLTTLEAVEGNPDGTYSPERLLNRAEFLKIVLLSHPDAAEGVEATVPWNCFPDVSISDWFAPSVCYAKEQGIVAGYPDGRFLPGKPVNYVEALKMLTELYGHDTTREAGDQWFSPYVRVAETLGLGLEANVAHPALLLTRGQMARLAAAYRAEEEGELAVYRDAEQGILKPRSSSSSSRSSSSQQSSSTPSSSSSSSQSSSSPFTQLPDFPVASRFLVLGARTRPILQGTFTVPEDSHIRIPEVTLRREIRSIERLYLIDAQGREIMPLELATSGNAEKRIWRWEGGSGTILKANTPTVFGIVAVMKPIGTGASQELWEIEEFSITAVGTTTGQSRDLVPSDTAIPPMHQTALGRIGGALNALTPTASLRAGTKKQIASFSFSGSTAPGAELALEGLTFRMSGTGVAVSAVRIGDGSEVNSAECSMDPGSPGMINCDTIPSALRTLNGLRTLSLYATVAMMAGKSEGSLQILLDDPGTIGRQGAVRWTDGTSHFTWVDLPKPVATGTRWSVLP